MNKQIKKLVHWVTGRGGRKYKYAIVYARCATENKHADLSTQISLSLARLQSEQMSRAVKRGLRQKKEREQAQKTR